MVRYEFESIDSLLASPEGEQLQFKEAKNRFDFTEATKICCALANGGGGKLVLGITDERPRIVVGSLAFPQPERVREQLINRLHITIDFQLLDADGKRVLILEVASRPTGLPVQVDGIA